MVSYLPDSAELTTRQMSLNPCCSGQWSRTVVSLVAGSRLASLNPCCSGQWSRTDYIMSKEEFNKLS